MPGSLKETAPPLTSGATALPRGISTKRRRPAFRACAVWFPAWPSLASLAVLGGHVVSSVDSICAGLKVASSEAPSWTSLL